MKKLTALNALMNTTVTTIFVFCNIWALHRGFEETFIALAIAYGGVVVFGNLIFLLYVFLHHKHKFQDAQ